MLRVYALFEALIIVFNAQSQFPVLSHEWSILTRVMAHLQKELDEIKEFYYGKFD